MTPSDWLEELAALAERYGHSLPDDLEAMTTGELWGLYEFLRRKAEGERP